jgi:hypothetical protein
MFWHKHKKVAVALTCADWRLHNGKVGLNKRLCRELGVGGVDLIAVPGPDGLLRPERESEWQVAVSQISLLIGAHTPVALTVLAHQRCAGHPVSDHDHDSDVMAAAQALKAATEFSGPVLAYVAVYHNDAKWGLKRIGQA